MTSMNHNYGRKMNLLSKITSSPLSGLIRITVLNLPCMPHLGRAGGHI